VPFVFNAERDPAHSMQGTDVKPGQFSANPGHVEVIAGAPGQSVNPFGHDGLHSIRSAIRSVIAITNCDDREQWWLHNHVTGNARA